MPLSDGQQEAVLDRTHHLMIEAGAGSGKTTTLVEKILYEMGLSEWAGRVESPIDLDQVVAVTFTRKAAGEIKDRLRSKILDRAVLAVGNERERLAALAFQVDEADIGTIDSLASRIVRDFGPYAGVDSGYELLGEGETAEFRREVASDVILDAVERGDEGARAIVKHFGFVHTRRFLADQVFEQPDVMRRLHARHRRGETGIAALQRPNESDRALAPLSDAILLFAFQAVRTYGERLIAKGFLDFPHMALAALRVVANEAARAEISGRTRLLIVDEHQDTSPLQAELLFGLAGLPSPGQRGDPVENPRVRLVLIGDPKQSIYSFRHADVVLWGMSKPTLDSVGGRYIVLDTCYRSVPGLIAFSDVVLGGILRDRSLHPYDVTYQALRGDRQADAERPVEFLLSDTADTRAVGVRAACRVRELLDDPDSFQIRDPRTAELRPVKPRDIAILAPELRSTGPIYMEALKDQGIAFRTAGGSGLYQRQEVQDVVTLLSAIADPYDPFALAAYLRSPFAAVDDLTIDELARGALEGGARSLFDALRDAGRFVADPVRRDVASTALELLTALRSLRDRIGHDDLIRKAVSRSGYSAFLAGAPDAPLGLRNLDKLIRVAAASSTQPLFGFAGQLANRVERADQEEEAPLYATNDDLVTLSTIHSAKGLEWPVVVVTELHTNVVRGVRRDSGARISPNLGVVLPLDVVLRERGQAFRLPAEPALWQAYATDQTARDYAERKRLFYVACTRARDRLILAGALNELAGPRRLVSSADFRTRDSYDRWLQILIPSLSEGTEEEKVLDHRELRAVVRRPRLPPAAVRDASARDWPHVEPGEIQIDPETLSGYQQRTGPVAPGPLRTEFAVSEFLQFNICPWKHFYGYRAGLSSPRIETSPDDSMVHRILPERRGEILHHYLGEHDDAWDEARMRPELLRVLLWHLPMEQSLAEQNVDDLLRHVRNYLESDVHRRVRAARDAGRTVKREVPFLFRLAPGIHVRGILDLLFEDEDGWAAVDYKTGLFGDDEAEHEEIVRARTERYEIQAALYSMAAIAALPAANLKRFHFFFTPPGMASTIDVKDDWPGRFREPALAIVERIRASDYGLPIFRDEPCGGCEYRRVCRPVRNESYAADTPLNQYAYGLTISPPEEDVPA